MKNLWPRKILCNSDIGTEMGVDGWCELTDMSNDVARRTVIIYDMAYDVDGDVVIRGPIKFQNIGENNNKK